MGEVLRLPTRRDQVKLRLPEQGRIRTGEKGGPTGRRSIPTFRFTSRDETALGQVAALYGGTVQPWRDRTVAPGQFELKTSAAQIEVALPKDPYPFSWTYEMWTKGGCQRRCDTYTVQAVQPGPEGSEMAEQDCICWATQQMSCKLKVRLNVILPDVDFGGTWRLETSSENAKVEMEPMVNLLVAADGLTRAVLRIEKREEMRFGRKKMFQVPKLAMTHSITELTEGAARIGALPAAEAPKALPPSHEWTAPRWSEMHDPDDDVAEAEIVFDPATGGHEINEALCDKFRDGLTGHQRVKAVVRARALALDMGEPMPSEMDKVSYKLIDALMAEGEEAWA